MKMAILGTILTGLLLAHEKAWSAEEKFAALQAGSVIYTNAIVTSKTSTHIFIQHATGIASVKLIDVSPELQKHFGFQLAKTNEMASPSALQPTSRNVVKCDNDLIDEKLRGKIGGFVINKNFKELEKMATELRTSRAMTANQSWHLGFFYEILSELDKAKDSEWQARIKFLAEWIREQPDSITARVALARCYVNYAWFARGSGYANTVSDVMYAQFQSRLDLANQTLLDARDLKEKCPVWWSTMQTIALGKGWDRAAYENLFAAAISFDRTYTAFYCRKAMYLLPRWYGEEGEWQKFASESADKMGGEEGDILFACICWGSKDEARMDMLPRFKKGMAAIVKKYPDSNCAANKLAWLTFITKDKALARETFQKIGSHMDDSVWKGRKDLFQAAQGWALN